MGPRHEGTYLSEPGSNQSNHSRHSMTVFFWITTHWWFTIYVRKCFF